MHGPEAMNMPWFTSSSAEFDSTYGSFGPYPTSGESPREHHHRHENALRSRASPFLALADLIDVCMRLDLLHGVDEGRHTYEPNCLKLTPSFTKATAKSLAGATDERVASYSRDVHLHSLLVRATQCYTYKGGTMIVAPKDSENWLVYPKE